MKLLCTLWILNIVNVCTFRRMSRKMIHFRTPYFLKNKVGQKCFVGGPPLEEMVVCGGNTAVGVHQWRKQRSGESARGTQRGSRVSRLKKWHWRETWICIRSGIPDKWGRMGPLFIETLRDLCLVSGREGWAGAQGPPPPSGKVSRGVLERKQPRKAWNTAKKSHLLHLWMTLRDTECSKCRALSF